MFQLTKTLENIEYIRFLFTQDRNNKVIEYYHNKLKNSDNYVNNKEKRQLYNKEYFQNKLKEDRKNDDEYKLKRKLYMKEYYINKMIMV